MKNDAGESKKRILVALDAFQDYQSLLDLAAALALHQSASLTALFVEDINLIRLAGLPFAMEIDRISLNEQQLDALRVSQNLERKVEHIRRLLNEVTRQSRLQVSLTVVRGNYLTEAMAAAADADLLLLNPRSNKSPRPQKEKQKKGFIRPVWVVFDGSDAGKHSLEISGEILKNHPARLSIVLNLKAGQNRQELEKSAREIASGFHVPMQICAIRENDFSSILDSVLQQGCSIMIMNWSLDDSELSKKLASSFSEKAGCPVLLVT